MIERSRTARVGAGEEEESCGMAKGEEPNESTSVAVLTGERVANTPRLIYRDTVLPSSDSRPPGSLQHQRLRGSATHRLAT